MYGFTTKSSVSPSFTMPLINKMFSFFLSLGGVDKEGRTIDNTGDLPLQTQEIFFRQSVDQKQRSLLIKKLSDEKNRPTSTPRPPSLGMDSKNLSF